MAMAALSISLGRRQFLDYACITDVRLTDLFLIEIRIYFININNL